MSIYEQSHSSRHGRHRRKPDRKRRVLKKAGYFFLLVAGLCLAVSVVFLLTGLFQKGTVDGKQQRLIMAGIACGGALVAGLFYLITLGARRLYASKKGTSHRSVSNSGSVLLMVLIILAAATGMILKLQFNARSLLENADKEFEETRLNLAAADMARDLLQVLANDEDLLSDHWSESWAEEFELEYPDGVHARGRIFDEQRFFDLNNLTATRPEKIGEAAERIVLGVMRECGIDDTAFEVDALRDWMDADGEGQFESRFYMQKDTPYKCPNQVMEGLDELGYIAGWSRGMFVQSSEEDDPALAECLTVLPTERREPLRVNVNTAPPAVLHALLGGGSGQLVDLLVSMRKDSPLRSVAIIENAIGSRRMRILEPFLDVKSNFFRIVVEVVRNERRTRLEVLARRVADGDMHVMRWSH